MGGTLGYPREGEIKYISQVYLGGVMMETGGVWCGKEGENTETDDWKGAHFGVR